MAESFETEVTAVCFSFDDVPVSRVVRLVTERFSLPPCDGELRKDVGMRDAVQGGPKRSWVRSWRIGFGVDPRRAGVASFVGLAVGVVGVVVNGAVSDGDLRVGPLPWTMVGAMGCLAYCSLGVLSFHRRVPNISLTVGALWTALAFLGIGAFFLALAIGGLLGIEEEEAGAAIIPPLLGVMFGVASMGPASLVLAVGVRRARLLPSTTRAAFWGLAFAFPALLLVGLSEGTIETVMSGAVVGAFAVLWLRIGWSVARPAEL